MSVVTVARYFGFPNSIPAHRVETRAGKTFHPTLRGGAETFGGEVRQQPSATMGPPPREEQFLEVLLGRGSISIGQVGWDKGSGGRSSER